MINSFVTQINLSSHAEIFTNIPPELLGLSILLIFMTLAYQRAVREDEPIIHSILLIILFYLLNISLILLICSHLLMNDRIFNLSLYSFWTLALSLILNLISAVDKVTRLSIGRNIFLVLFVLFSSSIYYLLKLNFLILPLEIISIFLALIIDILYESSFKLKACT